jgi:hypothetical protein
MSQEQPLEKKKWWYACKLFGMNSLKERAMWYIYSLLGKGSGTNSGTTAIARQMPVHQWTGCVVVMWEPQQTRRQQES